MATSGNKDVKVLNIKLFKLMEAVKTAIESQNGTFFYPFRGNDYKQSGRSIKNGYIFPGDNTPYVKLHRHKSGEGHYHLNIEEGQKPSTYSAYLSFYDAAVTNMTTDFPLKNFSVKKRNYIVLNKEWDIFKSEIIQFIISNHEVFYGEHYITNYTNNIANINGVIQNLPKDSNPDPQNNPPDVTNKPHPLNLILYGPPGTGKTYNTVNRALEIVLNDSETRGLENAAEEAEKKVVAQNGFADEVEKQDAIAKARRKVLTDKFNELKNEGRIEFITFHQSMGYEDFVEGIKPVTKRGKVTYKVKPGIFKHICERANDKDEPYVLIIDEINRGNVSQIFGELITLIEDDKRLGKPEALTAKLPYSHDDFGVPQNLYIIGTMNTADRSVEALDTALRRRFSFEEMMPKYDATGMARAICGKKLCDILWTINQRIEVLKGREQQIGHSYLMKCKNEEDLKDAFKDKIVPLLQEYFYGDYSQIGLVLGSGFVKNTKSSDIIFPQVFESPSLDEIYHLLTDEKWKNLVLADALGQMSVQEWINPNAIKETSSSLDSPLEAPLVIPQTDDQTKNSSPAATE